MQKHYHHCLPKHPVRVKLISGWQVSWLANFIQTAPSHPIPEQWHQQSGFSLTVAGAAMVLDFYASPYSLFMPSAIQPSELSSLWQPSRLLFQNLKSSAICFCFCAQLRLYAMSLIPKSTNHQCVQTMKKTKRLNWRMSPSHCQLLSQLIGHKIAFAGEESDNDQFSLESPPLSLSMPILMEDKGTEETIFLHTDWHTFEGEIDWHKIIVRPETQKDEYESFKTFFNPDGSLKTWIGMGHEDDSYRPSEKRMRVIKPCTTNAVLSKINIITLEMAYWPAYSSQYEELKMDIWYDLRKPPNALYLKNLSPNIDTLEGHKSFEVSIDYAIEFVFSDTDVCHVTTDFNMIEGALLLALFPFPGDDYADENMLKRRTL